MEGDQLQMKVDAALAWFTEFQFHAVVRDGIVPEWFHGIISRKTSEEMLQSKLPGYFLIRVSESRFGYTLSYRVNDRCRHFMIDALTNGNYVIVGENLHHRSLQNLVDFHRKTPLMPFNDLLTLPCGQVSKENLDYAQLIFPKRKHVAPHASHSSAKSVQSPTNVHPILWDAIPPALPERPTTQRDSAGLSANVTQTPAAPQGQPNRLYPCLQVELLPKLTFQNCDSMMDIPYPVPLPRKMFMTSDTTLEEQPPELPARVLIPPLKKDDSFSPPVCPPQRNPSTPTTCNQPSTKENLTLNSKRALQTGKNQDVKASVIHIMNFKKKFLKKRSVSQEHMYAEITPKAEERMELKAQRKLATLEGQARDRTSRPVDNLKTENKFQEVLKDNLDGAPPVYNTHNENGQLPYEYLQPPPFAPGHGSF